MTILVTGAAGNVGTEVSPAARRCPRSLPSRAMPALRISVSDPSGNGSGRRPLARVCGLERSNNPNMDCTVHAVTPHLRRNPTRTSVETQRKRGGLEED
jgi:hypothetical protein